MPVTATSAHARRFRHEAVLYAGPQGFTDAMTSFVRHGIEAGEPTLVMVTADKIDRLRTALGPDRHAALFADMGEIGRNPSRIIASWQAFVSEHAARGTRLRGIGEPIWAGRGADELLEAQRHEHLLNLAFDTEDVWILCPYDRDALPSDVLEEVSRSHPWVGAEDGARASEHFLDTIGPFTESLEPAPASARSRPVSRAALGSMRRDLSHIAAAAGLEGHRIDELVLAVSEVATNCLRHGDGTGTLASWLLPDRLVVEVRGPGRIDDPLAGRRRPTPRAEGGYGLFIANQLCDLVQIRSTPDGSVVRLHVDLD